MFRPSCLIPPLPAVNRIRTLFERRGEALERGVEHRPHQHRQHPAPDFVGQETRRRSRFRIWFERSAVFEVAEQALQILDHDLQVRRSTSPGW